MDVNEWEDRFWNNVVALPVVKGYSYPLPVTDDYQLHRVEVKIDSLPAGEYGILVSSDKNFALAKNAMAFTQVYVSDISYVNNNRSYYVLNRKTGVPLSKAKVQVWETYYNQSRQKQDIRKLEMYSTSDDGYFELKREAAGNGNTNILLDISTGSDRLFIDRPIYNYVYDGAQGKDTITTQIIWYGIMVNTRYGPYL